MESSKPHVVIIPHPLQGHVTPMLHLAELLCLANLDVTFLSTTHIHQGLTKTDILKGRFGRFEGFRFEAVTDGLPDDHSRSGQDGAWAVIQGFTTNAETLVREMLVITPVTCFFADGWMSFPFDVAKEADIPVIVSKCYSASNKWVSFCLPQLIEQEEIPFKDEDLDCLVQNAPGMDSFLRYRDLPSFCRILDKPSSQGLKQGLAVEMQQTKEAYGLILNTFEDLEGPILSLLRSECSRVYSIGPLHAHVKHRLNQEKATLCNSSSSLWEADQSCLSWLDQKPDKSVVYVSFGSLTILERKQLLEIWAGLVQSKKYFLWVMRTDLIIPSDTDSPTPPELLEGTKERGCLVSWSPQEAVLAHRAIGGFLTHSGWNSTLESIIAGVPMLCWPYFADQQVNSRYVSEVMRIGLDMKDTCDRDVVEKMVHDLMDERKEELQGVMTTMSDLAKRSINEGGSSYSNFDRLIQDIKMMSIKDDEDSMNQLLKNAPGLSTFLRYRDLPRFCRLNDVASCREIQQSFATEMHVTQRSHALILNTCEELEGPILDLIRSRCTQTYSIGPLHTHLRNRLKLAQPALSLNSGFEVTAYIPGIGHNLQPDQSWLSWLEQKPDKSVLYVSFGSITMLEKEQLTEIWAGLVQSQKYFMWAVRPNLIIGGESDSPDPEELLDGTKDRGLFAGWVPQEEVLAHRAVGGFLTHSGWNSTLESLTAGVPMLCWPYFGDQQVNSRCVSEVWRIGLDMKDTCDRNVVAQMIRDLMDCRNVELQTSVAKLSELAERSVTEGGSSYCNLDSLIHDIQQMAERHNNVNYYPSDSKAET